MKNDTKYYENVIKIILKKEEEHNKYFEKLKWRIVEYLRDEDIDCNITLPSYDIQKSFYGKAYIHIITDKYNNYAMTLYSYNNPVLMVYNGVFKRLWKGWSQTTGRHIKAFCGFNKAEFFKIPYYGGAIRK